MEHRSEEFRQCGHDEISPGGRLRESHRRSTIRRPLTLSKAGSASAGDNANSKYTYTLVADGTTQSRQTSSQAYLDMLEDIKGRFYKVTGAASGIGRATVIQLAELGAGGIAISDVNEAGLAETTELCMGATSL